MEASSIVAFMPGLRTKATNGFMTVVETLQIGPVRVSAPDPQPFDDADLMARIARGEIDAFERFYDATAPTLYGVLLRMLRERDAADEALQDAYGQLWRSAGSFDGSRGSAIAYLIQIGRSRALDRIRAEKTRREREMEAAGEIAKLRDDRPQMSGFLYTSVEELRGFVQSALEEIPPEQREPIELAYYDGMTQREIAERLGQPLGTVKTRVLLGMRKLRARLGDLYTELKA